MARRVVVAVAVTLLALMALAPVAGAQEGPYTNGVEPVVEERPAIVEPAPQEEAVAVVQRPADVADTEVLAATGFGLSTGVALSVLLLGLGAGFVLLARRRRHTAA
jgi:hypothetical protein